jgi:hypothetical protein
VTVIIDAVSGRNVGDTLLSGGGGSTWVVRVNILTEFFLGIPQFLQANPRIILRLYRQLGRAHHSHFIAHHPS